MTAGPVPSGSGDLDGQFRFWVEEKLRNMDTDQFGHVNNAAIATFCESGRMGLFGDPRMQDAMEDRTIVVARLLIEFRRELFFPGIVRVGTNVASVGRTSFRVVQGVFDKTGLVATSDATCVMLDAVSRKPTTVPDSIRAYLLGHEETGHGQRRTDTAPSGGGDYVG